MMSMMMLVAQFNITKVTKKVAYCNNNVIPLLKKYGISWDMDTRRIIFLEKVFPMKYIDDGEAEEFIKQMVEGGQSRLDLFY